MTTSLDWGSVFDFLNWGSVFNGSQFHGWGAEFTGAVVGGIFALVIALLVSKSATKNLVQQIEAERLSAINVRRLDQFAELSTLLLEITDTLDMGVEQFDRLRQRIILKRAAWATFLATDEERKFDDAFRVVLGILLQRAWRLAEVGLIPNAAEDQTLASQRFRSLDNPERALLDGIIEHGRNWNADPSLRSSSYKWFKDQSS